MRLSNKERKQNFYFLENMDRPIDESNMNRRTNSKRGHQHHIKNSGIRRSNVPADEVIAALRSGDILTIVDDDDGGGSNSLFDDNASSSDQLSSSQYSDIDTTMAVDNDNNYIRKDNDNFGDDNMLKNAKNKDIDNNNAIQSKNTVKVLTDLTTGRLNEMNVKRRTKNSTSTNRRSGSARNSRNFDSGSAVDDKMDDLDQIDSISSSSSSSNKKTKRDPNKRSNKTGDDSSKRDRQRRLKSKIIPPSEERPPLEGAADDVDMADIENDPEVAEWSKLRCTSERTEVVAEREYRRQNRRCADYPGLAFGRSIFSSDTMMKFNIIRNELHNIMKTQLKRVWQTANINNEKEKC